MGNILPVTEQYPEPLKKPLERIETTFQAYVQRKLELINRKALEFVKERLTVNKSVDDKKEFSKRLEPGDFILDLSYTLAAYKIGSAYNKAQVVNTLRLRNVDIQQLQISTGNDFYGNVVDEVFIRDMRLRTEFLSKALAKTTIEKVSNVIDSGTKSGASIQDISKQLETSLGFDNVRAEVIARTEVNYATNKGIAEHSKSLGITKQNISVATNACSICVNTKANGPYDIDEDILPLHPNDRCVYVSEIPNEWFSVQKTHEDLEVEKAIIEK